MFIFENEKEKANEVYPSFLYHRPIFSSTWQTLERALLKHSAKNLIIISYILANKGIMIVLYHRKPGPTSAVGCNHTVLL